MIKIITVLCGVALFLLVVIFSYQLIGQSPTIPVNNQPVACTAEAKLCPDGSAVGRTGPNCEFAACPDLSDVSTKPLDLVPPVSSALDRITKKPFGIKISPADSPVQPEKFSGYHTGTDFEIFPGEENAVVTVHALCDGPVRLKRSASGYGGVVMQECTIAEQTVTVVYGHLAAASVTAAVGDIVTAGKPIGVLGTGYSAATDGERKHLHLAIHRGDEVDLRGYVQRADELSQWLNALLYLPATPLLSVEYGVLERE